MPRTGRSTSSGREARPPWSANPIRPPGKKISSGIKALGYQVTAPETAKDALKAMRFHVFDVVVVNELFDTANPEANDVLQYLESLNMTTRRRFFVALVSEKYRTMDNMAAFQSERQSRHQSQEHR